MRIPSLALGMIATLGWIVVMRLWGGRNFYPPLGMLALALLIALLATHRAQLRAWLCPTLRNVAAGVVAGVTTVAATHGSYWLVVGLWPGFRPEVIALYRTVWSGPGPVAALPIVVLAVVVEELVWRGALLEGALAGRGATRWLVFAGSTTTYALAQLGSGSWLLVAVAFLLGALWGMQRLWDGSLVSALLAHLMWSLSVLVFMPLESLPG